MKSKLKEDYWKGYIKEVWSDHIYVILEKDFHESKSLMFLKCDMTNRQIKMAKIGLCLKFDIVNGDLKFMFKNGNYEK